MGQQLIFCMETNKKSKSDYIYIKSAISYFYRIDQVSIKLSPVYMDGKGNYDAKNTVKRIADLEKQYKAGSRNNRNVVIYCFDCDDFDSRPEDKVFLEEAKQYCEERGYRFVWFGKDIENVFLGKRVPDNQKKKQAEDFARKRMIKNVEPEILRADRYQTGRSNLFRVLDDYLKGDPSPYHS